MPVYMDRHQVPKGTPLGEVLNAHEKDMAVEHKHMCKARTFWLDDERGYINCLIEAPTKDHVIAMHAEAHGLLPNEIMEVPPDLVMAFLGRLDDLPEIPLPNQDHASSFRTVVFTDLKDSTAMHNRLGDAKAMEFIRIHDKMIRNAIDAYRGREVKHTGDGFMLSFIEASDAVGCAVAIQRSFAEYNAAAPEMELHVRIGLAAGEPMEEGKDLFGCVVQRAARLCSHAQPGETLVDGPVRELATSWQSMMRERGQAMLKGFDDAVAFHEVQWRVGAVA
jgi:class 3 adenylate cyclase